MKFSQCKHSLRKKKCHCWNIQSKLLQAHNLAAIAYVLAMKFIQCKYILRWKKYLFLNIVETFKVIYYKYTNLLLLLMFQQWYLVNVNTLKDRKKYLFFYCWNIQSELLQVHNPIAIAYVSAMKFSQCKHILRKKKYVIVETYKVSYCKYTILLLSIMF